VSTAALAHGTASCPAGIGLSIGARRRPDRDGLGLLACHLAHEARDWLARPAAPRRPEAYARQWSGCPSRNRLSAPLTQKLVRALPKNTGERGPSRKDVRSKAGKRSAASLSPQRPPTCSRRGRACKQSSELSRSAALQRTGSSRFGQQQPPAEASSALHARPCRAATSARRDIEREAGANLSHTRRIRAPPDRLVDERDDRISRSRPNLKQLACLSFNALARSITIPQRRLR